MYLGQEIYMFFNKYGNKGLIGIFISITLIESVIYKTFKFVIKNKSDNYQTFLREIMPQRIKNNKILENSINNIINIFLLISFNIMVSGFATYFFQELIIPKLIGTIIIAVLSFVVFSKSIEGVIKINTYLIPILILLIIFLGIKRINSFEIVNSIENYKPWRWIVDSILYASYNSITLIPILVSLKNKTTKKEEIRFNSYYYYYYNANIINNNIFTYEYILRKYK